MKKMLTSTLALSFALTFSPALAVGKTLTVAYPSDFQSLDPAIGYDTQNWPVEHALFVTLLNYDAGTKLRPWGATDLGTVSADGKTYTFHIKKGITFADGEPTDAAAFKYALERVLNPKTKSPQGGKGGWFGALVGADAFVDGKAKTVSGIKVLDPYTLEFQLKSPDPPSSTCWPPRSRRRCRAWPPKSGGATSRTTSSPTGRFCFSRGYRGRS